MTGMILQVSPMKEYDRRIEILTKERGRISAFAQGARRANSALSACTILFTFGTFVLREGRDSYNLVSGKIQTQFGELAQDYDALCYCSYFGEMARHFTRENLEAPQELMLMYLTVKTVMSGRLNLKLVRVIYELRMMMIQGEMIELFSCLRCGREGVRSVYFNAGGLICPECAGKDKVLAQSYPTTLSQDALYTIQYILTADYKALYAFEVTEEITEELQGFMKKYLGRFLNHHFKTLEFIEI